MAGATPSAAALPFAAPAVSRRYVAWRRLRKHRLALVGMAVLFVLALISFSAPLWLSHERTLVQVRRETFASPSAEALFGRDEFGRDAFARAVYGGRVSLWVALS